MKKHILIAGESYVSHSTHMKGVDSFATTEYVEAARWLRAVLEAKGWTVTHMPNHIAARDFPATEAALKNFDCVLLSDIGANTFLLHPDTVAKSIVMPNRLHGIRDYVKSGGGLVMAGGWLSFQGFEAKAQYAGSAVEEALPVTLLRYDDRIEAPQGVKAKIVTDHPIITGIASEWPILLGHNQVSVKEGATLIATADSLPLLVAGNFGKGRSVAFTSDCAPHWAPPGFIDWPGYALLWNGIVEWAAGLR